MKDSMKAGVSDTRKFNVDMGRTVGFMGDDCRVYATPSLVCDIEDTCRDLAMEHSDTGEDSVGFKVSIMHSAPTLMGMDVTITATIAEVDRARIVFDIIAKDGFDTICTGQHERFVVSVDKTRQRLLAKAEKAAQSA